MSTFAFGLTALLVALFGEGLPTPAVELTPEQAARLYRVEVYNTFRLDRMEFERRREIGEQLWTAFDKAGRPAAQRQAVIDWFTTAREGQPADLPPIPELPQGEQLIGDANTTHPVLTSAQEDKLEVDLPPIEAVQSLHVQLPHEAVQTGPSRFFSSLVKTTLRAAALTFDEADVVGEPQSAEEVSETPELELTIPRAPASETPAPIPTAKPAPLAPPSLAPSVPSSTSPSPRPTATSAIDLDVEALFAPAQTPVTPPSPPVSEDPFGVN
jgi:hypothetical protein